VEPRPDQQPPADAADAVTVLAGRAVHLLLHTLAPDGALLVVGAGEPSGPAELAARGRTVTVVDPAAAAVEAIDGRAGVQARRGDPASLPFEAESFHGVVVPALLADDRPEVVSEVRRVLAGDGVLVAAGPAGWSGTSVKDGFVHVETFTVHDVVAVAIRPAGHAGGLALPSTGDGDQVVLVASDRPLGDLAPVVVEGDPGWPATWRSQAGRRDRAVATMAARLAVMEQDAGRLAEAQRLLADAEQAAAGARELRAERDELARQVDLLLEQLDDIHRTITWRATQPVRRLTQRGVTYAQDRLKDTAVETLRRWRSP
jgi:SAM-dependent methyltransferase